MSFNRPGIKVLLTHSEVYKLLKNRLRNTDDCWMGVPSDKDRLDYIQYGVNEGCKLQKRALLVKNDYTAKALIPAAIYQGELHSVLLGRNSDVNSIRFKEEDYAQRCLELKQYKVVLDLYRCAKEDKQPWYC